jgi:hypothetical protein
MAAVQKITMQQPTKIMRLHLMMVQMSDANGVGLRGGCDASIWRQLRGNILYK